MWQMQLYFQNLTDLKIHFDKVHIGNSSINVEHSKQNRKNKEEFDCYFYTFQKLFSSKKTWTEHYKALGKIDSHVYQVS